MTAAQTTALTATILAIDLGKYKGVACLSRSIHDQRFVKFPTCRAQLTRLLGIIRDWESFQVKTVFLYWRTVRSRMPAVSQTFANHQPQIIKIMHAERGCQA